MCVWRSGSWTHVGRLFVVVDVVDVSGQAEVGDLHDVALRDQNVPRRQVPVYALRGEGSEGQMERGRGQR